MTRKTSNLRALAALIVLLLMACTRDASVSKGTPELAETLTIHGWEGYLPQSVMDAFTAEYGVKIEYVGYGDPIEAVEAMAQGEAFDVVVLDNVLVQVAAERGLLAELDHRSLSNFTQVANNFRDLAFDPQNKYSIPFQWGTSGLLYRADLVESPPTAWADLWNPAYAGKIGLWPYDRDIIGIALKSLGYSYNTQDPQELAEAGEWLMELRGDTFMLDTTIASGVPYLLDGEAEIIFGWAYDMQYAADEQAVGADEIVYILPEEGSMIWMDNLIIPASSPHQYTAELFLNFIMRPQVGAQIANEMYVAVPNEGAYQYIEPEILNNPLIFPTAEELEKAEFYLPIGPEAQEIVQDIWSRFTGDSD